MLLINIKHIGQSLNVFFLISLPIAGFDLQALFCALVLLAITATLLYVSDILLVRQISPGFNGVSCSKAARYQLTCKINYPGGRNRA